MPTKICPSHFLPTPHTTDRAQFDEVPSQLHRRREVETDENIQHVETPSHPPEGIPHPRSCRQIRNRCHPMTHQALEGPTRYRPYKPTHEPNGVEPNEVLLATVLHISSTDSPDAYRTRSHRGTLRKDAENPPRRCERPRKLRRFPGRRCAG